ncbi:hypothetical protein INT44_007662 [Umbelopsis vinacea]|uniref:Zn(2)-C6 fungal-type domain-containing protein n=1 Tax=Umbelopsis vinacea TaxID=44442 RepID=A0A8H7PKJ8_9FUNG|nr:hypothetical protein INT44_007662 [Umbelopsis vinacea]
MTPTNDDGQPVKAGKRTRSAKACTACRQMKLKCDAMDRFPSPCSRCTKNSHFCEIDRNFQRERKRRSEAVQIPQQNQAPTMQTILTPLSQVDSLSNVANNTENLTNGRSTSPPLIAVLQSANDLQPKDEAILGTIIPGHRIRLMFDMFINLYHRHLPILPLEYVSPAKLSEESPLLFWSICSITVATSCPDLTDVIHEHVRDLISKSYLTHYIFKPFTALSNVCAMVFLCYWPLTHRTIQEDASWTYCGLATHMALQIGLHRFTYTEEYAIASENRTTSKMKLLTWLGCFLVNQLNADFHGVPSTATLDYTYIPDLTQYSEQDANVADFIKRVKILHALKKGIDVLGTPDGTLNPSAKALLHRSVEDTFSQLLNEITPLSEIAELTYLHSKLQLHSFLLTPDVPESDQKDAIIPTYLVCMQHIQVIRSLLDKDPDCQYWPFFIVTNLLIATVVLFKLTISPFKGKIDVDVARNNISDSFTLLKRLSTYKGDMASRSQIFVEGIKSMYVEKVISPQLCPVKTRLGAGIFTSTLLEYKKWQRAKTLKQQEEDMARNGIHLSNNTAAPTKDLIGPFFDVMTFDDFWNWDVWPDTLKDV